MVEQTKITALDNGPYLVRGPVVVTDADGNEGFNQELSEKRAQAVADYLVQAGLPAERFKATGYGGTQPLAGNDTDDGKAQNRRIEFVVK